MEEDYEHEERKEREKANVLTDFSGDRHLPLPSLRRDLAELGVVVRDRGGGTVDGLGHGF
jgi:hypothetical protein